MNITAAVLESTGEDFSISEIVADEELFPNEVLVRIVATGLCHTDISARDKVIPFRTPAILGHEGAGIVEKVGSTVTEFQPGDSVVLAPASCGKCAYCQSGHPSYCVDLFALNFAGRRKDGSCPYHDEHGREVSGLFYGQSSFATYSITTENNLVKVDPDIQLEILGPLGCGLQTGAGTVLNVLKPIAGDSLVVFGVGAVGLAAIMAANASGCSTIIAVDVHRNRLHMAEQLGATHTIDSSLVQVAAYIKDHILPAGLDFAVDTTGRNEVINQAVSSLRPLGRCALVGMTSAPQLIIDNDALFSGKSVQYVLEGDSVPRNFIPRLIRLYQDGLFPFDKMLKFYELSEINQAILDSESGETLKAIIRMPHG
ncbi:MAG: NAD(P)-dependent alcohol dehydrogenase [Chitinophagaceae bacterium]